MRKDNRQIDELRSVEIVPNYIRYPEGSVLIRIGDTHVLCNATVEPGVPHWMQQQNIAGGWVTGEYALLPRATHTRTKRETSGLGGRTQEIRRLIGRSLRAALDLEKFGAYTCIVDCDVLQADGGTRTAAITGGYVALALAVRRMVQQGQLAENPLVSSIAAISAGVVDGQPWLDLNYEEDSRAEVDMNVVMTSTGQFIEIQSTAERAPFSRAHFKRMLSLAEQGISQLLEYQHQVINQTISGEAF